MILQALLAHYEALAAEGEIALPGWEKVKVSYALEIGEDGSLLSLLPLKVPTADGKKMLPKEMELPAREKRSVGISANFLSDNAAYFLGIGDTGKPERVLNCFTAAKELHSKAFADMENGFAKAICNFFKNWIPEAARENPWLLPEIDELEKGANLVFFFKNKYPQEDAEIRRIWQQMYDGEEEGEKIPCLVTGEPSIPVAVHPSIKGVNGAQSSGAALVSFNAPAYCSFNKTQNLNAPVSKYAAFAYTTALNHLLSDKKHVKRIGDSTVVYWAKESAEVHQDAFSCMIDGEGDTVSNADLDQAMTAIAAGRPVNWGGEEIRPDNRFYVLALAPNAARLSVRFFLTDRFGDIIKNLKKHYDRAEMAMDNRSKYKNIPLWSWLRETINEKSNDKTPSPQMAGATLRAILTDTRYPATLYQNCQLRIRAEKNITRGRASILKAYLLQNTDHTNYKEALEVKLNEQTPYQPYVLGRLFAVAEAIQDTASGVTTIKDKYFTSACATPAVVFPMILNLAEKHMRKLNTGNQIYYAKLLGTLMAAITESYPAHHSLYDQGVFQLGYYHQTQKRYEKKEKTENTQEEKENV